MSRLTAKYGSWLLILSVALSVRLGAAVWWQSRLGPERPFFFADSSTYWELAETIAQGQPYQYRGAHVFRTPGYPALLAVLFPLFGGDPPPIAARILNAAFGTLSVAVVGWWTTQLFEGGAGRIAGWIAALYPGAVAISSLVLSESPFSLFMLLELGLWSAASRAPTGRRAAALALAGGIAAGAATLIRPSWLLFTPLAAAISLAIDRRRGRQVLIAVPLVGGLIACMVPWWMHNVRASGHFVATTLQVGASLYDGLNPMAYGGSDMAFVEPFAAEQRAADEKARAEGAMPQDSFEYRLDRRMLDAALNWARDNPSRVLQLAAIKFVRLWNVWPNEPSLRAWPLRLVVLLTYVPLLCLSMVGIWRFGSRGWPYVLAWLPAAYFTLIHMVFVSSIRYREPAALALVVLASGVALEVARRRPAVAARA